MDGKYSPAATSEIPVSSAVSDTRPKKVLVLGGDGFCGWPTSLHLSDAGHEVIIVDNLSRRNIDIELGVSSLTPIATPQVRVETWNQMTGKEIRFINLDLAADYDLFLQLIKQEKPDSIVHFAEQRAAPYSMKSSRHKRYTINNNVGATHNVLAAIVESGLDIHLVHLGTMGVYGYGNSGGEIPEGYIDVVLPGGREKRILHPAYPGSIYHTTKCLDALLFQFYVQNDQVRVTDLHQGIVWGTNTPQTARDERLVNRFDYDGDYGTVLNRFLMQGALGIPLTVYGTGGQTRALIHITDTSKCIELAINNPPKSGSPVEILNQIAQTARVRDLAQLVSDTTGTPLQFVTNPRQEAAENPLEVSNQKFKLLGLSPIMLDDAAGLLEEVKSIANKYKDRCATRIFYFIFYNYDQLNRKTGSSGG
ncbi:hypothetical protein T492DRAFT_606159 [Pavlovales sp. CCMP2436]|nr:hypothetical protein T492DRAFT_606159 [Pavlovales sp. CCMP2436]